MFRRRNSRRGALGRSGTGRHHPESDGRYSMLFPSTFPGVARLNARSIKRGCTAGFTSGVTDFDTYIGTSPCHVINFNTEWFAPDGTFTQNIDYDLGALYSVFRMAFWNEESWGTSSVSVFSATDATFGATTLLGDVRSDQLAGCHVFRGRLRYRRRRHPLHSTDRRGHAWRRWRWLQQRVGVDRRGSLRRWPGSGSRARHAGAVWHRRRHGCAAAPPEGISTEARASNVRGLDS